MSKSALDTLLDAAILAPSGDNTQPWRFAVDRSAGTIDLRVDASRDPSPMNSGQRMARIALGAALENMTQTADRNGWSYRIENPPSGALARFTLDGNPPAGTIEATLADRNTNRRTYDGRPLSADVLEKLSTKTGSYGSAKSVLITDPATLARLVNLVSRADAIMLGTQALRNAFLAKVRFDAAPTAEVDHGLSLGSLEVSLSDRLSLRMMHTLPPPDGLMRALGARRIFSRVASKLASSASAICLIVKPIGDSQVAAQEGAVAASPATLDDAQSDLDVGRAWQRLWLELTRQQLAGQPMMSLLVLKNVIEKGDPRLLSTRDLADAQTILQEFYTFAAQIVEGEPAVLMRIGTAPAPTSRVRRMAPSESAEYK